MFLNRPSTPLKQKINVNPVITREQEATAEDFAELASLLNEYANEIETISQETFRSDFLGYFGDLSLLQAQYPNPPQDSFGIITDVGNNPTTIYRYLNGAYVSINGSEEILFYNQRSDFPPTGLLDKLYIAKNERNIYGWYGGNYNLLPDFIPTLQQVTNQGSETDKKISVNRLYQQGKNEGHSISLINEATSNQEEHSFASISKNILTGDNFNIASGKFIHAYFGIARYDATGVAQNVNGIWGKAENKNLGKINDAYGVVGQVRNTGNGDITKGYGVVGACRNNGTGTITEAVGVYGDLLNVNANGLILSAYSLKAATPFLVEGNIENLYGVFIDQQNPAGTGIIDKKYALYSKSDENSYLKGNLGIGVVDPVEKLEVDGNGIFNGAIRLITSTLSSITNTVKKGFLIFNIDDNNRLYIHDGTQWHGVAYKDETDNAVNLAHEHTNKSVLDNFGENANNEPTYNGNNVDTTIAQRDVVDNLISNDNSVSLSAKQGKVLKDNIDNYKAQTTGINAIPDLATEMQNELI